MSYSAIARSLALVVSVELAAGLTGTVRAQSPPPSPSPSPIVTTTQLPAVTTTQSPIVNASQSPAAADPNLVYSSMLSAMSMQPAPRRVAYDETFTPKGLGLRILQVRGRAVVHIVFSKDSTPQVFHIEQRSSQDTARVVNATSGQRYTAELPFWSAPWVAVQGSRPIPGDQSTVISSVRERMVSDLRLPDSRAYAVSFVGVENLNGLPVDHLHLTARDASAHPLTDLYLDPTSHLVRRAVGTFRDNSVTSVTGDVMLNFDRVGKFWMISSGQVDATVHAFFTRVSGSATFAASHVIARQ